MKNFMKRIECIVEPSLYYRNNGEFVQITMRCRTDNKECGISKIEEVNFLSSHFDLIFDHMREDIKSKFLEEVVDVD